MSTTVIEQQTEAPVFDSAKFIAERNAGKVIEPVKTAETQVEKTKEPVKAEAEPEAAPRLPRSVRREMNRLREELGYLRAKAEAAEAKPTAAAAPKEDAEPIRKDFASDAEYLRATQKWDKAQEAKAAEKGSADTAQTEQFRAHLKAMDEKAAEDIKTLADWEEVSKAALEDEDAPEFDGTEHPTLMGMLAASDVKAFALYHFAKHPDEFQKMLDLTKDPNAQIKSFHRLEGRLEKMYDSVQKPAQGSEAEKPKEDRKHLAEAEPVKAKPGETAAGAIPAKPKPSSEVAARGGSPAPDAPVPGTAAWNAMRNQAQFGR